MTTTPAQTFTTVATDDSWKSGLHPGHVVELQVYGQKMVGKLLRVAQDNITVRIPIEEQSGDVRRFSVTGTAVISIDGGAAQVPVSVQSTGEFVRLQFIGAAELIQRRRHVRLRLSVPVQLAWQSGPEGAWNWAASRTLDLSEGGLRVASARAVWPSIGERVQVSIELPQETVTETATVIGKTADYDLRLAFAVIAPQTRMAIAALAAENPD